MARVALGPFELVTPIGRGGMGQVWSAVHRDTQVPVAVKVLHPMTVRDERSHESFHNEVRAIASLDHPGVAFVFATGQVDRAAAVATEGQLVDGSPYLAMEHASGGTLSQWVPPNWGAVRAMLLDVLEGLAHAHSRTVIHRDLKPSNVLHCTSGDIRPGWKLTDFGIAAALEETIERSIRRGIVGTLSYMAPEQIRSSWRDFGPWTDLYALGCIVYRVVGSQRPFAESNGPALMVAHLTQPPVPFSPMVPVPQGFADWVARLLEKQPRERFQTAADASLALRALGAPPTLPDDLAAVRLGGSILDEPANEDPTDIVNVGAAASDLLNSGLPTDWRSVEMPGPPPRLVDTGLGLFGLRTLPLVGREADRDVLWGALCQVARRGSARVVVMRGAAGVGKSRLIRWLGETANARGGVPFLFGQARHGEPAEDALLRALQSALHTVRLGDEQRLSRLTAALGSAKPDLVRALSALLAADGEAHGMRVEGVSRHGVIRLVLEQLAGGRPLVFAVDDMHHSADTLAFVHQLLDAQQARSVPILVILSARSDAVADAPVVGDELAALEARQEVRTVALEPLAPTDHARLIAGMIPFERTLAAQLEERTAGNPLHAVQVVRDWVAAGRLHRGPGGYELDGEVSGTTTMAEMWREPIERLLSGLPEAAAIVLEQAAALGHEVTDDVWQQVSDDPKGRHAMSGTVPHKPKRKAWRRELRQRMIESRLATESLQGWVFAHEMVRDGLLARAERAGRLQSHHRACARALLLRPDSRRYAEEIGRHLRAGGRADAALEHLFVALSRRRREAGDRSALPLLAQIEGALQQAEVPDDDRRWCELAVERAAVFNRLDRTEDALRWAETAGAAASEGEWPELRARALVEQGRCALTQDPEAADGCLARAESLLREPDDQMLQGEVQSLRARCARFMGDTHRSRAHARLAAKHLTEAGERSGLASAWHVLGRDALDDGEFDGAQQYLHRARYLFERGGDVAGQAQTWMLLGHTARGQGELAEARLRLQRALELYRDAGSQRETGPRLALARVALAQRDWGAAHAFGSSILHRVEWTEQVPLQVATHGVLAAAAAGVRNWRAFELHLGRVRDGLQRRRVLDPELAWSLTLAANRARASGQADRADRADALAAATESTHGGVLGTLE